MAKRRSLSLWKPAFFGLTQEYRAGLFRILHEIVFYGRGGYTWEEVYNFPIWLRRITYNFIKEYTEKEHEAQNKGMGGKGGSKSSSTTNLDWANPDKSQVKPPSYVSRASKK
jgi:hypothetical protein